jgi:hypothetical protein
MRTITTRMAMSPRSTHTVFLSTCLAIMLAGSLRAFRN